MNIACPHCHTLTTRKNGATSTGKQKFQCLSCLKQYVEKAHNFFASRDQLLTKVRPNGEILLYDTEANIFGAFTNEGVPKTIFKPKEGIIYWETRN